MLKKDLNSFRKDLEAITSTIGKTKYDRAAISNFFIVYGTIELLLSVTALIVKSVVKFWPSTYTIVFNSTLCLATVFLLIYFFRERRSLKQGNSVNTLKLFDIWGFVMLLLPALMTVLDSIAKLAYSIRAFNGFLTFLIIFELTVLIIAFIATLYFTGVITEDKNILFIAVVFAVVFVACYYINLQFNADKAMEDILAYIYHYIICFVPVYWASYILLGVYFKVAGRIKNEDE